MPRWQRLRRWAFFAFFYLTSSLLLLELVLRLLTLVPWSTPTLVADPALGFRVKPLTILGGNRTNRRGFNDHEWPSQPEPGRHRWAVVGDSFVFGALPRSDNLVERLRGQLPAVELLNLGILAAGPENYLAIIENEATSQGVERLVLVFFVGNDIHQAHPDFHTRIYFGSPRALLRSPWHFAASADYIYVLKLWRGTWRFYREELLPPEPGGTFSREIFLAVERQRLEICRRQPDERTAASYDGARQFFADLRTQSERLRIPVAVVLAPDQFQVEKALASALYQKFKLDPTDFDLELPQRRLLEQATQAGLPTLDLLPEFRRVGREKVLYLERDTHWNAAGNELAAQRVGEFVESWGKDSPLF